MASENKPEPRIIVDEDWKSKVEAEREQLRSAEHAGEPPAAAAAAPSGESPKLQAAPERLPPATFLTLVETLATTSLLLVQAICRPCDGITFSAVSRSVIVNAAFWPVVTLAEVGVSEQRPMGTGVT